MRRNDRAREKKMVVLGFNRFPERLGGQRHGSHLGW